MFENFLRTTRIFIGREIIRKFERGKSIVKIREERKINRQDDTAKNSKFS